MGWRCIFLLGTVDLELLGETVSTIISPEDYALGLALSFCDVLALRTFAQPAYIPLWLLLWIPRKV